MNRHHDDLRARMAGPRADPEALKRVAARLDEAPGTDFFAQMQVMAIDPLTQLHGCDLTGFDLHRVDLSDADLRGTDFARADLAHARLSNADMTGASLRIARLEQATLIRSRLGGADLRQANLRKADLRGADLAEADLRGAALLGARLDGTVLVGDLGDFSRLIASPRHLLSHWPGSDGHAADRADRAARAEQADPKPPPLWEDETPLDLPPRALVLLVEAMLRVILEALVLRGSGVDIQRYRQPGMTGLFVPHLFRTNEELAERLEPHRLELMAERRVRARSGTPIALAETAVRLGDLNLLSRNFADADQFYRTAYDICRTERRQELVAALHGRFGCLALDRVDRVRAVRHINRSLDVCDEIGHAEGRQRSLLNLAALALLFGDSQRAAGYLQRARAVTVAFDRDQLAPRLPLLAGAVAFRTGDRAAAVEAWGRARDGLKQADLRADAAAMMKLEEIAARWLAATGGQDNPADGHGG